MSEVKVNKISPRSGTTVTLGDSGDTFTIPSGATINNQGTATNFGATGSASWTTTVKTNSDSGFTAVAGEGYFLNTTAGTISVNLPAGTAGAVVAFKDYAGTWDTNAVTLVQNGSDKIGGSTVNATLDIEGLAVTLVFIDSTQGWLVTDSGLQSEASTAQYIAATGGNTTVTCGDYKIHTFTSPGTFCVSSAGNAGGSNSVDYLVVAGGAGGGTGAGATDGGGGGGAGGFREGYNPGSYTASPLATTALPVTATAFPITVGGGGAGSGPWAGSCKGSNGSNSIFSTIISAGGGGGGSATGPVAPSRTGADGGSGGGGAGGSACGPAIDGGAGNTPPVSPSQGNSGGPGGAGNSPDRTAGGGGGATAAGVTATPSLSGDGGAGATTSITGSPVVYAGGGGASGGVPGPGAGGAGGAGGGGAGSVTPSSNNGTAGTTNTGGGGGSSNNETGGAGGSGIVVIRYKFQN